MRGLTDVHCHILPEVDDGAKSVEETFRLLQMEADQGVTRVFLTPHYRRGMFETTEEEVRRQYRRLRLMLEEAGNPIHIYLGREYHADSRIIETLNRHRFMTMNQTDYVLVEFPYEEDYHRLRNTIYELVAEGYDPIVAHAERYACLRKDIERNAELRDLGALIQVNAGTILGNSGFRQKAFGRKLMEADYVDLIGSDAHNLKNRMPNLGECYRYVEKKMGEAYAERIFYENPQVLYRKNRRES